MEWIRYGPDAVILRFAERPDEAAFLLSRAWVAELEANRPAGLTEVVPAFTTILLQFSGQGECDRAFGELSRNRRSPRPVEEDTGIRHHEIPVRYGGPDLDRVAATAGMRIADVIRIHSAPRYRVHCLGFSPAFPYLGGLDPRIHTPRLETPRLRVPAGSVAIGGEQTGIYSIPSPGGWNLIGRTDTPMFRPDPLEVEDAFFLRAGDRVQFIPVASVSVAPDLPPDAVASGSGTANPEEASEPGMASLRIQSTGVGISIQDLGRPGYRRFGVPAGGVMDPHAAGWANRLLENPPDAPVLEMCLQGQCLEVLESGWMAWTGGAASGPRSWSAFRVRAGEMIRFPGESSAVWSYVSVPGGFLAPRILGSASANPRAAMGARTEPGSLLFRQRGSDFSPPSATDVRRPAWVEKPEPSGIPDLPVWPGPQWECFSPAVRDLFFSTEWTLSSQCDRVGYRLMGPELRSTGGGMISEPVLPGSIQVPPGGQPIVTMPDGPTLGGYPKLGILEPDARVRLARCQAGQRVRFSMVT